MQKTLKFAENLVPLVLSGTKTSTWRSFDDKDLKIDDELSLMSKTTLQEFAKAKIISVKEKTFGEIEDTDFDTHERYENKEKMLEEYRSHYGDKVNEETVVKIIHFELHK